MTSFLVIVALLGGFVGTLAVIFTEAVKGTQMIAVIALACLAGILARISQAADHREAMDKRLNALFKMLEKRQA
jgi:Na+/proline symporter